MAYSLLYPSGQWFKWGPTLHSNSNTLSVTVSHTESHLWKRHVSCTLDCLPYLSPIPTVWLFPHFFWAYNFPSVCYAGLAWGFFMPDASYSFTCWTKWKLFAVSLHPPWKLQADCSSISCAPTQWASTIEGEAAWYWLTGGGTDALLGLLSFRLADSGT